MTHTPEIHHPVPQPGWILSNKVSIGVYIALGVQAFGFVWWAATTDAMVKQVKVDVASVELQLESLRGQNTDMIGRVIRLEEKVEHGNDLLAQILANLQTR